MRRTLLIFLLVVAIGLVATLLVVQATSPRDEAQATTPQGPAQAAAQPLSPKAFVIDSIPHVLQKPDFCGEACVEMYLRKLGQNVTQDDVFNASGLDPQLGRGCYTADLQKALTKLGFTPGAVAAQIDADQAPAQLEAQWQLVEKDLRAGLPSILCMHYSDQPQTTEHFRLVVGYDPETTDVIYHEPAEKNGAYRHMKKADLLKLWPLKYSAKVWTVITLRLAHEKITSPTRQEGFTDADYAQHILELKKRVPAGFTVVLQKPFVVLGDEPAAIVRQRAEQTVSWAVARLKALYFSKDPADILDIWLFKDKASYEKYTKEIFNDQPTTPYGYFSHTHKALIMNIATGGGTLVHEIVHPFVAANFPECPSWFNEGLGSLYEQSSSRDNMIIGLPNWRLPGLQKAIAAGAVPTFEKLTATTTHEFYNQDRGTNYAQARYLCYYLQQKGLLKKFYHEFYKNRTDDPTGYKTLVAVLGEKDMADFQKHWEKFVLGLKFP